MIINLESPTELSGFYIVYNGSVNNEKEGYRGLSHLAEHLICKNFDHLQDDFDSDGIDFNAYTSQNNIVFHITGLQDQIVKWRDKFIDLIGEFNTTEEDLEKEKNIVSEELLDSFNSQWESHYLNLDRKLFNNYNAIGSINDVQNITFDNYKNFISEFFSKPSKIINVTKNKPFSKEIEFKDTSSNKEWNLLEDVNTDYHILNNFEGKSSVICLSKKLITEDFGYIKYINTMLGGGLNSPLYQEIREKRGLVYYVSSFNQRLNNKSLNYIATVTSNENAELITELVNEVISNPDKYLTKERFDIVKNQYLIEFKKSMINRYKHVSKFIDGSEWSVESILQDLSYDKLKDVYNKWYLNNDWYYSIDNKEFK